MATKTRSQAKKAASHIKAFTQVLESTHLPDAVDALLRSRSAAMSPAATREFLRKNGVRLPKAFVGHRANRVLPVQSWRRSVPGVSEVQLPPWMVVGQRLLVEAIR